MTSILLVKVSKNSSCLSKFIDSNRTSSLDDFFEDFFPFVTGFVALIQKNIDLV